MLPSWHPMQLNVTNGNTVDQCFADVNRTVPAPANLMLEAIERPN
jgi:hypothetical protein